LFSGLDLIDPRIAVRIGISSVNEAGVKKLSGLLLKRVLDILPFLYSIIEIILNFY